MYSTKMFMEESDSLSYLIGCVYEGTECVVNAKRIVAFIVLLFGLTVFLAEETSMLASQTRATPIDTFDRDDTFSKYHREALEETNEKKMKVEMNMIENIKKEDKEDIYDTMVASFDRVLLLISPVPMRPL
jgi:hypothetical protein